MLSACAAKESPAQPTAAPQQNVQAASMPEAATESSESNRTNEAVPTEEKPLKTEEPIEAEEPEVKENTVTVETVTIMKDEPEETELYVFTSSNPGETFFIVGGIHGDEEAGWKAADRLCEQIQQKLKSGTLYLLPHANNTGIEALTRHMTRSGDLNRAFPGDSTVDEPAMRLAAEIFGHIEDADPVFVLDLHEARKSYLDGSVGNTLIYTLDSAMDVLWDFLVENEDNSITDTNFTVVGPGVKRSINRTVSDLLNIPIVTVETLRSEDIEHRIQNQLAVIDFCLKYYNMV